MIKRLTQAGDTIVEVLIALIIVSTVLAGAYVTSNRSLTSSRQAQERGEALKFVETQLEQIKAHVDTASTQTSPFCFSNDNSGTILAASNAACKFGSVPGGYQLQATLANSVYTVTATWERAGGGGQDNARILYRVTPQAAIVVTPPPPPPPTCQTFDYIFSPTADGTNYSNDVFSTKLTSIPYVLTAPTTFPTIPTAGCAYRVTITVTGDHLNQYNQHDTSGDYALRQSFEDLQIQGCSTVNCAAGSIVFTTAATPDLPPTYRPTAYNVPALTQATNGCPSQVATYLGAPVIDHCSYVVNNPANGTGLSIPSATIRSLRVVHASFAGYQNSGINNLDQNSIAASEIIFQ